MPFPALAWDLDIFKQINQVWRYPFLDCLMPLFSDPRLLWASALLPIAFCLARQRMSLSLVLVLGLGIGAADMSCSLIKAATQRSRPYAAVAGTWYQESGAWLQRPAAFAPTGQARTSFPSAHAANAAAAALILYSAFRKKSIWFAPLLIGYSRIYLGKHFPLDVLAGWLTGLGVAGGVRLFYSMVRKRFFSR